MDKRSKYYFLLIGFLSYLVFSEIHVILFQLTSMKTYQSLYSKEAIFISVYGATLIVITGNFLVIRAIRKYKLLTAIILFGLVISFRILSYNMSSVLAQDMMLANIDFELVGYLYGHDGISQTLLDLGFIVTYLSWFLISKGKKSNIIDQDDSYNL